jgi:hypothetical protein
MALCGILWGCSGGTESTMKDSDHMKQSAASFWRDAKQTADPIGEGGKGYYPYQLRGDLQERASKIDRPLDTYQTLLSEEKDPVWREVLLFLVAHTPDPRADDVLIQALEQPELRPRALYLLGAIGTKGWPSRDRDRRRILGAILGHVDDATPYQDVYYRDKTFQVGDLAKAAYVRVAGVDEFPEIAQLDGDPDGLQARFIGMALPLFSDADRARLATAIRAHASKK